MEEVLHYFLQPHEPTTDCDTFMDTHMPPSNTKGIQLEEFSRYDRRQRSESQSPPPSYKSRSSITEVRSNENNGNHGPNIQIATISDSKLHDI